MSEFEGRIFTLTLFKVETSNFFGTPTRFEVEEEAGIGEDGVLTREVVDVEGKVRSDVEADASGSSKRIL